MRAVAKTLQLSSWSPCLLYESVCDETAGLPGSVVFSMLDELIEGVRKHVSGAAHGATRNPSLVGSMTLRIENNLRDRLNEAVLPGIFYRTRHRTCQASFYSATRLQRHSLCDAHTVYPFSCFDHAVNFDRLCRSTEPCKSISTVPQHITRRLRMLQRSYPNASLDMVVLDAVEDFLRGGVVSHGSHNYDIVTFIRVQLCDSSETGQCSTVAVDDYRYEAISMAATEREWFPIVAMLRGTGQVYAWARVGSLVIGIIASVWRASTSFTQKTWLVLRTILIIPSHIVVYGSIVPVICYAAAHALDSSLVYEQCWLNFGSLAGAILESFKSPS
ncbi:hypothetical protein P43SY_011116 [Pythium insidiosum]|uniref:Transmembrane protein n=1 Tax=Pythium insidiosum TaxID=114742 RepID=A0AAD5L7R6_PYTIN|nr:hypothetical protein P43SY_011116 [Pythium insidiosum]